MTPEWQDKPASSDKHGMPGKILAEQREALGWSVEQVADQLKLAVRQVVALEAGDYANLPGPAVVRGFVRAYAKVVRLDPVPLVAMISLDTPEVPDNSANVVRRDKPASFSEVRFPTNGKRAGLPLVPIGIVVLLAAAAVGAWQMGLVSKLSSATETAAPATVATPAPGNGNGNVTVLPSPVTGSAPAAGGIETTVVKPGEELKPINPSVPLISVPPPTPAAAPGTPAAAAAPAAAAPAAAGANALVINVREDSWVEVRRAKGRPLLSKLVKAGSTETVEVTEPVTLIVGKPSAVDATLRGTALTLPSTNGTVARVALQ